MNQIPVCPLMSAGQSVSLVCLQEDCGWYMKAYKTCAVYILAHNAALDIKKKQTEND